jgi:hypothetical protein
MTDKDLVLQFRRGFTDGAGGRPINSTQQKHPEPKMAEVYIGAYTIGQRMTRDTVVAYANTLGVTLSPIRVEVVEGSEGGK